MSYFSGNTSGSQFISSQNSGNNTELFKLLEIQSILNRNITMASQQKTISALDEI